MNHGTGELEGPRLCLVQYCQFAKEDSKEPSNEVTWFRSHGQTETRD